MLGLSNGMKKGGRRLAATLMAVAMAVAANPAYAGSFQVNPVNVELPVNKSSTAVTLRNVDEAPVSIRVVALKWTQENGEDVYAPTKDIIMSPPIFTIPSGGTQIVRFGTRAKTPGGAYRVIFEEIPNKTLDTTGVQVALRLDLPLYILNEQGDASVRWTVREMPNGEAVLVARNDGTRHAQIVEISTVDSQGKALTLSDKMGVVLPKSSRHWRINRTQGLRLGSSLPLSVRGPHGESRVDAIVEHR